MNCTNKAWQKPEMTVLVRSNPEESVLVACKTNTGGGPTQEDANCASGGCQANQPS